MNNYTKVLSIAVGATALSLSASAKDLALTDYGDLILGIYATAGTGNGNTLQVNLGEFTNYAKFDGSVFTVSELARADLDTFGTGTGFARSTVSWGVIGGVGNAGLYTSAGTGLKTPKNTLFATSATGGLSFFSADTNSLDAANPSVGGLYGVLPSNTTASNVSSAIVTSDSFSWKGFQTDSAPVDFGFFTASVTSTTNVAALALYELIPSNALVSNITETGLTSADRGVSRLLGTFNLASDGTLTYTTASAIPEPSSYAAIAGVAMLGFVAARRRRSVNA